MHGRQPDRMRRRDLQPGGEQRQRRGMPRLPAPHDNTHDRCVERGCRLRLRHTKPEISCPGRVSGEWKTLRMQIGTTVRRGAGSVHGLRPQDDIGARRSCMWLLCRRLLPASTEPLGGRRAGGLPAVPCGSDVHHATPRRLAVWRRPHNPRAQARLVAPLEPNDRSA